MGECYGSCGSRYRSKSHGDPGPYRQNFDGLYAGGIYGESIDRGPKYVQHKRSSKKFDVFTEWDDW